jgi:hypothetical protein
LHRGINELEKVTNPKLIGQGSVDLLAGFCNILI